MSLIQTTIDYLEELRELDENAVIYVHVYSNTLELEKDFPNESVIVSGTGKLVMGDGFNLALSSFS